MNKLIQQNLFPNDEVRSVAPAGSNALVSSRLSALEEKVFTYLSSDADKKYFKQRIVNYLQGKDKDTLTKTMWDACWLRNDKGYKSNYLYFNERSQRLYLDNDFWEWCKLMWQLAANEIERSNGC